MRADTGSRRCTALLFLRRPVLPGLFLILRRLRRRFALVLRGRLLLLLDPVVELLQTTVRHRLRVSLLLLLVRPPGLGAAAFVRHDQPLLPSIDSCRPTLPPGVARRPLSHVSVRGSFMRWRIATCRIRLGDRLPRRSPRARLLRACKRVLRRASPVRISRTIRSATGGVMSAEPTPVGITSTSSA